MKRTEVIICEEKSWQACNEKMHGKRQGRRLLEQRLIRCRNFFRVAITKRVIAFDAA